MNKKLPEIRESIDHIDQQIVTLLNERFKLVHEVGQIKRNQGQAIYVPEREKALLQKLEKLNQGPMPNHILRDIYREIMSGAISLEKPISIAYLGPQASFSQLAALGKFGHSVTYVPQFSIADVFREVEIGRVDYGCVPIENSTEGAVNYTLDMFLNSEVKICAEILMRIHQNVMANCAENEIQQIFSHPQVFGQCRNWLQQHMPKIELIEQPSTTHAALNAANTPYSAAIASNLAAEIYHLNVLYKSVEDQPDNTTRFLIIGKQDTIPTDDDKTSLCFGIQDRVGALYDSLVPFKNNHITMTMIESRPSKRKNWEYFFYVDILGNMSDPKIQSAILELRQISNFVKCLGSYPKSTYLQED